MDQTRPIAAVDVARREMSEFQRMAERIGMDAVRQRRLLGRSCDAWLHWLGASNEAPLPADPALPVLLRHLGYLTSRLDRTA